MKHWFLLIFLPFQACNIAGDNNNEIIKQVSNGEGKKAVLFTKYGGATVDNSTQVALMENDEQLTNNQVGNIFTCNQSESVKIQWLSVDTLEIIYGKGIRVFTKEKQAKGINVVYKIVE